MGDAKDILGLPKGAALGGNSEKRGRAPKDAFKKPDGVSREISWQWLPFATSARSDNLQLYHWVRIVDGLPPSGDYAFAKYNKAINGVRYTDEEYNKYLFDPREPAMILIPTSTVRSVVYTAAYTPGRGKGQREHYVTVEALHNISVLLWFGKKGWSRQETDQLFDLCEQFDLRFIIIADRFTPPRTVEELKGRYYSAAKAIVVARTAMADDVTDHTLIKDSYNMAYEVERKRALGILLSQTRQQEREDAEVLAQAKRITQARLIAKVVEESELPMPDPATATTLDASPMRATSPQPISTVDAPVPAPVPMGVTATPSVPAAAPVPVPAPVPAPAPSGPRLPRVYLRAALLAQQVHATVSVAGVRTAKRVDQMLDELGIRAKPKVPTPGVCSEHLELRKEVLGLLQLQKQVQWKESEVATLRENPYADIPATPNTPKRSHRGGDHERVSTRATAIGIDADPFSGERVGKREHKRKAPARFSEAPSSPPYHKRARKLKGSEG